MSRSQWERTVDAIEESQKQMVALARSDDDVSTLVRQAVERLGDPDREDADWDYRRYAELLEHLGLDHALGELTARARTSGNPEVREIADDFEATAKRPLAG